MSAALQIEGTNFIEGQVEISGAKNSALPILAASLLCDERVEITNVPLLNDVTRFVDLLRHVGAQVDIKEKRIILEPSKKLNAFVPTHLSSALRASILLLAPLLTREPMVELGYPGGCSIGSRPIDQHIKALRSMNVEFDIVSDKICAQGNNMHSCDYTFEINTVTGSANAIMAAVKTKGVSRIGNIASEPEVDDLINFLIAMGAKIQRLDLKTVQIEGGEFLHGGSYALIGDRIECGTYLCAAMLCGGSVTCTNINPLHLESVIELLTTAGADISHDTNSITLSKISRSIKPFDFSTAPFPGIPTDMQAQLMVVNSLANGESTIHETIFENRFKHVKSLNFMGANISVAGSEAHCVGVEKLLGQTVVATDLRASAALILAGLSAEGTTTIKDIYHLDRGYEKIEKKLTQLGAKIKRV